MSHLNHFTFSPLVTAITTLGLGIFILAKGRWKTSLYLVFALYSFSISLWSFCSTKFSPSFQDPYLVWGRLLHVGAIFIPPFFIHFVFEFLKEKDKKIIYFSYLTAMLFLYLDLFTKTFITGITSKSFYSYPTPGITYPFYFLFFIGTTIFGLYKLYRASLTAAGSRKNQIKYLFWSSLFGYMGGLKNFTILLGLEIFPIYPYGTYAIPIYVLIVTYAIIHHHLMDIKVFIKKSSLIIGSGVGLTAAVYYANALFNSFLEGRFGPWGSKIPLILGIIIFIYVSIYALRLREKEVRQELEDERTKLNNLVSRIEGADRLKEVFVYIPHHITVLTSIDYAAIAFIKEEEFSVAYQIRGVSDHTGGGLREKLKGYIIADSRLMQMLKDGQIVKYSDVGNAEIGKTMEYINAHLIVPSISGFQLLGFLILGKKEGGYDQHDIDFFKDLAQRAAAYLDKLIHHEDNIRMLEIFKESSLKEIDEKDNYTYWHTKRVAQYSLMIAKNKKIYPLIRKISTGLWGLALSAELHDIGKKCIPDEILKKQGALTNAEYRIMQSHSEKGLEIIYKYSAYLKKDIILGVVQHHENYDGSGYSKGLKGVDIHLYAHIIHLADVFDAMTSNRPYRAALSVDRAVAEMEKYKGVQFHPQVVDTFLEELEKQPELIKK